VALYGQVTGRVAAGKLRAALDASPLCGVGRVEDTINLLGHALRKVVGVVGGQQGWGLAEGVGVLGRAGRHPRAGSVEPQGRAGPGLGRPGRARTRAGGAAGRAGARGAAGRRTRRRQRRAGRCRARRVDRAYLPSGLVRDRDEDLQVFCKVFPVRGPGGRFAKPAFHLDFDRGLLTCPNSVTMPFAPRRQGPVPRTGLSALPAAGAVHHQQPGAQRPGPPRRAAAGRAARRAADPGRPCQAAPAHRRRARPGARRPLAGRPRPLPRGPQGPVRPAPGGGGPQPPRHRPPTPPARQAA
jgi:hypothetical protein